MAETAPRVPDPPGLFDNNNPYDEDPSAPTRASMSSMRPATSHRQTPHPSANNHPYGRPSIEDSPGTMSSRRPLRETFPEDNEEDAFDHPHPDMHPQQSQHPLHSRRSRAQSRPPPAHLNRGYQFPDPHSRTSIDAPDATPPSRMDSFLDARPKSRRRLYTDEEMGYDSHSSIEGFYSPPRRQHGNVTSIDIRRGGNAPLQLDWKNMTQEERKTVMRLPWLHWMHSSVKNHFVACLGEFVGTTMFLFFAFAGTEVANIGSNNGSNTTTGEATGFNVGTLLYISLSFGFSLMVNVWVFFRISGGLFNPAVTLGMLLVRAISVSRAVCLLAAQICGSLVASVMVRYLFPQEFNVRTTLGGGASLVQGIFIEAILTAELVFTIFMLAKEKHRATFIAPVGIGLALFIAELVGVQYTGGSLNPARSFGPCVVTATFDAEHWIYWVGPMIGALIAVVFYKFIKILEYEMANPGADGDPTNDPTVSPEKRMEMSKGE